MKTKITRYVANDDTTFKTEIKCRAHDAMTALDDCEAKFRFYDRAGEQIVSSDELDKAVLCHVSVDMTLDEKKDLAALIYQIADYGMDSDDEDEVPIARGDLSEGEGMSAGWYYVYANAQEKEHWKFIDLFTISALRNALNDIDE